LLIQIKDRESLIQIACEICPTPRKSYPNPPASLLGYPAIFHGTPVAMLGNMRHLLFSFGITLLVAALTAACTHSVTSPSAVGVPSSPAYTVAQLQGTWILSSIQPAGEAKQDRPFNATYTLTFDETRLSTRVDCNSCGGGYSVNGTTLTAGPNLACTRAACPTMAFENAYTSILSGDSTTVVTNSTLTLSSARGTLQFVRN
jgi:heat shock protein HslJ